VEATKGWLNRQGIAYTTIMMREDDNKQRDTELKRRMLNSLRGLGCDVQMVFEDRQSVVDMWREEGVFCFQCAKGDY